MIGREILICPSTTVQQNLTRDSAWVSTVRNKTEKQMPEKVESFSQQFYSNW
jgi:hypothetical protein